MNPVRKKTLNRYFVSLSFLYRRALEKIPFFFLSKGMNKIALFSKAKEGITVIESLISVAVLLILVTGIYRSYFQLSEVTKTSQAKIVALSVVADDIELIRNLPFTDVGIQGAFPSGKLTKTVNLNRSSLDFLVTRTIRNVDDPFDGIVGGTPNDTAPADYKLAEIEVSCLNCRGFIPLKQITTVAPKNLEISSGGGALFIRVLNAFGIGVPQANVHIENKKLTPNLIIDEVTDNQGNLQLIDIPPSTGGYKITVTKSGYSSDTTYTSGNSDNPNPIKTDSTVEAGQVTQTSFFIDRVSIINVSTKNQLCTVMPNIAFRADGTKLIGTSPDVLKYSTTTSTDAGGNKILDNLEWDTYNFTITDPGYDLAGSIPFLPLDLAPNTTQNLQLLIEVKNPRSLLTTVKDANTNLPVTGATVRLEKSGYSVEGITGRGYLAQTDWSGGAGQINFIDPSRYFDSDGNIYIGPPGGELKLKKTGPNYASSGWLDSSTFDTGSISDFHNISWEPKSQPPDTGPDSVKFQAASNNDNATWNFVGPDGTNGSYYTLSNTNLNNHNGRRYFRYRVFLSTLDSSKTPNVADISFTFTSTCIPSGQVFFNNLPSGTYTLTVTHLNYQSWSDNSVSISADFTAKNVPLNPL